MVDPTSVRFRGPLAPHAAEFWRVLLGRGYTPLSACNLLRLAAHFSRWLARKRVTPAAISDDCIAAFAAHRRRAGYTAFLVGESLLRAPDPAARLRELFA